METRKVQDISAVQAAVFSLPMRDGNPSLSSSLGQNFLVFSLPMRDGNRVLRVYLSPEPVGF